MKQLGRLLLCDRMLKNLNAKTLTNIRTTLAHPLLRRRRLRGLLARSRKTVAAGTAFAVHRHHVQTDRGRKRRFRVTARHLNIGAFEPSLFSVLPDPAEHCGQNEALPRLQFDVLSGKRSLYVSQMLNE